MDIEDLNKTQVILVTLLVSFVTSLTTGIITVSLMDQAPPAVTQTINRVVERTVERVVPVETESESPAPQVIEKETTVVVKEDDLITDSIDSNRHRMVRVGRVVAHEDIPLAENATSTEEALPDTEFIPLAAGLIVSVDGQVAIPTSVTEIIGLHARLSDGAVYRLSFVEGGAGEDLSIYQLEIPDDESRTFAAIGYVADSSLKLGQTVIALSGIERTNVSMGFIADLPMDNENGLVHIGTNIADEITPGSPLLNIFGEVIGVMARAEAGAGVFTPASQLRLQLAQLNEVAISANEEDTTIE